MPIIIATKWKQTESRAYFAVLYKNEIGGRTKKQQTKKPTLKNNIL